MSASTHSCPCASRARQDASGSARCSSRAATARRDHVRLRRGGLVREQVRRGEDPDVGQRVRSRPGRVAEHRRVGERVAGQRTRQRLGQAAAGGAVVGAHQLREGLRDAEGATERRGRVHTGPQARQTLEQHGELHLRAHRPGRGVVGPTEQHREHPGRDPGEHVTAPDGVRLGAVVPGDLRGVVAGADPAHTGPGQDLGPGVRRDASELVGDLAHPADRYPALAGAVADEVVQEGPVRHQGRVVE